MPVVGGPPTRVEVRSWDWGEPTTTLEIRTRLLDSTAPVPSRLHVRDASGHPLVTATQRAQSDSSSGRVFQYSPGVLRMEVPLGEITVLGTHGFTAPAVEKTLAVRATEPAITELVFEPLWSPREEGWYAGDHHYHMNYGGSVRLRPDDLLLPLRAEDLDIGTPLVANLHYRFNDLEFFGGQRLFDLPFLDFGQEVRSHFLGHVGLISIEKPFWPWYWGPGYQLYQQDDRPNHEALRFARAQGGLSSYMHPVSVPDPFGSEESLSAIPVNLIPDAVLGDLDALEVACLWTSEVGTSELWHRLLDIGATVAASAGTDIMADYYRTMAVGAVRVYVQVDAPMTKERYLAAYARGRSFVTSGPLLDFRVGEALPGDAVPAGEAQWTVRLAAPSAVDRVEILVNGETVATERGLERAGVEDYSGTVTLPTGGWIAARAIGGDTDWPVMSGLAFAHSSPIWIGARGSVDPVAAKRAAADLLRALDAAERRLGAGYGEAPIPRLLARFAEARAALERIASDG